MDETVTAWVYEQLCVESFATLLVTPLSVRVFQMFLQKVILNIEFFSLFNQEQKVHIY